MVLVLIQDVPGRLQLVNVCPWLDPAAGTSWTGRIQRCALASPAAHSDCGCDTSNAGSGPSHGKCHPSPFGRLFFEWTMY